MKFRLLPIVLFLGEWGLRYPGYHWFISVLNPWLLQVIMGLGNELVNFPAHVLRYNALLAGILIDEFLVSNSVAPRDLSQRFDPNFISKTRATFGCHFRHGYVGRKKLRFRIRWTVLVICRRHHRLRNDLDFVTRWAYTVFIVSRSVVTLYLLDIESFLKICRPHTGRILKTVESSRTTHGL